MSSLGLSYAPHLDAQTADALERIGRRMGLPLMQIELLGQCQDVTANFIGAHRTGTAHIFLHSVDWARLEHLYRSHRISLPTVLVQ